MPTPVVGRHRGRFVPFALLVVMVGLLLFPVTVGAADPPDRGQTDRFIDQEQLIADTVAIAASHHGSVAQTVTAGRTGVLFEVDIPAYFSAAGYPGLPPCFGFSLVGVAPGGQPDYAHPLASGRQCLPTDGGVHWVQMMVRVPITAGQQYAIVIAGTCCAGVNIGWFGSATDVYAGGSLWASFIGPWHPSSAADAAFKTYVLTKEGCKDGGWRQVAGFGFKNQGQCIKYVKDHGGQGGDGGGDD